MAVPEGEVYHPALERNPPALGRASGEAGEKRNSKSWTSTNVLITKRSKLLPPRPHRRTSFENLDFWIWNLLRPTALRADRLVEISIFGLRIFPGYSCLDFRLAVSCFLRLFFRHSACPGRCFHPDSPTHDRQYNRLPQTQGSEFFIRAGCRSVIVEVVVDCGCWIVD